MATMTSTHMNMAASRMGGNIINSGVTRALGGGWINSQQVRQVQRTYTDHDREKLNRQARLVNAVDSAKPGGKPRKSKRARPQRERLQDYLHLALTKKDNRKLYFAKLNKQKKSRDADRDRTTRGFDPSGWQVHDLEMPYLANWDWETVREVTFHGQCAPDYAMVIPEDEAEDDWYPIDEARTQRTRRKDLVKSGIGTSTFRWIIDHEEASKECGWRRPLVN